MKIKPHQIEVTSTLILSGRELELLHHICSYDNKRTFALGIVSSIYAGGVSVDEIIKFMEDMRSVSREAINHINSGKELLSA